MIKMRCVSSGNTALIELIRAEIRRAGPISFARFMEVALYHHEHGYYASGRAVLGRDGDYLTNVSVGPAFGQLIARQLLEIWRTMNEPVPFVIVEQGADTGELALDILEAIQDEAPEFFGALQYGLIEPFAPLKERQEAHVAKFRDKVHWQESIDVMKAFTGVHLSNELFDALPFHLIRSDGPGKWSERCVTVENDSFAFLSKPIRDPELSARVDRLPPRPVGYESEISLARRSLLQQVARKLKSGYLLAIDYGFPAEQFYAEERSTGTLQCRAAHRLLDSPFVRMGESDITAHVEWSSLVQEAEACGFSVAGFTDQHHFLAGLLAAAPEWAASASPKVRRALQTLLHPEIFGRSFQVLALSKGVIASVPLSGFRFARDPCLQL
jgi:SAM-dependent MidA family methyltransferase